MMTEERVSEFEILIDVLSLHFPFSLMPLPPQSKQMAEQFLRGKYSTV